jgi:hypothetical protein
MFDLHATERERKDMQEREEKKLKTGATGDAFHCGVISDITTL